MHYSGGFPFVMFIYYTQKQASFGTFKGRKKPHNGVKHFLCPGVGTKLITPPGHCSIKVLVPLFKLCIKTCGLVSEPAAINVSSSILKA